MSLLFDDLPLQRAPQSYRGRPIRLPKEEERYHPWPLQAGINVVLFAGMGGACQGLEEAGFPIHVAVNHDEIAIAAHQALNPHTRHIHADIYEVCPIEATGGRFVNILWGSPDCFPAGSMVLTDKGLVAIEHLKAGMMVLTHLNRWRRVTKAFSHEAETVTLMGAGHFGLTTTPNHEIYSKAISGTACWASATEMKGKMWATPLSVPFQDVPVCPGGGYSEEFFLYFGRWIGGGAAEQQSIDDGWLSSHACGDRAAKYLPLWCLSMNRSWRRALLRGVVETSGHSDGGDSVIQVNSKALAIGLRLLATSLGYCVDLDLAEENGEERFAISWDNDATAPAAIGCDIHQFSPVHKVTHSGMQRVFSITVEEDESLIVDGIVVHNCRDHSVAKGGAPRSPRVRSMPWQMCRWVGVLKKRGQGVGTVFLENVREIRGWGPLIAKRDKVSGRVIKLDGTVAEKGERVPVRQQMLVRDPKRIGRTYRAWVKHIRSLAMSYEDRDLGCADLGVPTIRKRLFGVAHSSMAVPSWPIVTHGHRKSRDVLDGKLQPHVPAWTFIDWNLPMKSIFGRPKPLAPATQKRIAVGTMRFVVDAAEPFLVHMTHGGGDRVNTAGEPIRTMTTAHRGEIAAVSAHVTKFRTGRVGNDMRDSLPTLTANGYTDRPGGALPLGVVAAHLTKFNENSIGQSVDGAVDTLMAGAPRFGVVGAHLVGVAHGDDAKSGSRTYDLEESLRVITGSKDQAVVGAWMVQHNTGVIGHPMEDGLSTLVSGGADSSWGGVQQQLAGAYLVHQRGTSTAASAEDAVRAMTTGGNRGGDHVGVTAAFLAHQYSEGGQHSSAEVPVSTISTIDRTMVNGVDLEVPPLTQEQWAGARRVAEFLREQGVWNGGEVVTVGPYIVVDLRMRMLTMWEAAAAHELKLPEKIRVRKRDRKGNIVIGDDGQPVMIERPLTKTEGFRLIGNSVPRRPAKLLAEANVPRTFAEAA